MTEAFAEAQRIAGAMERSALYEAVGVDPSADAEEIGRAVDGLISRLEAGASGLPPPRRARINTVVKKLLRAKALLGDPTRRLHYDLLHGHVRMKERLVNGEDPERLREAWMGVFPAKLIRAEQRMVDAIDREAAGEREKAMALLDEALALDPFNTTLHDLVRMWSSNRARTESATGRRSAG